MKNFSAGLVNFLNTTRQYNRADLFAITPGPLQNFLLWSQDFTQSAWVKSGASVVGNNQTAPDGTLTAATITLNTAGVGVFNSVGQSTTNLGFIGTKYTFSVWLKAASTVTIVIRSDDGSPQNDTTVTVTTSWQPFSINVTPTAAGNWTTLLYITNQAATTFYAWHPQLEMRSTAGPYSPTLTTPLYGSLGPCLPQMFATSSQVDIVYQGNRYYASQNGAWERGKITSEASFDLRGNDMQLTVLAPATVQFGATGASLMAAAELGLFDAALVQVFTVYWPLGTRAEDAIAAWGVETKFAGFIKPNGNIARSKLEFEVADALYLLNQKMPKHVIQAGCRHTLYDPNCTMNPLNFMASNTVASGSTRQSVNLQSAVTAPPRYTLGFLTMTSGFNIGLSFAIKSQTSTTNLLLASAMPFPLAIGDTFRMFAGCDKQIPTCQGTFNNLIHFGGQPFVPNPETAI